MGKTPFPDNAPPIGSGLNDPNGQYSNNHPHQQNTGFTNQHQMGSGIGIAGEQNYTPGANISIGRAGEITPEPFQRLQPNAPPIGSGGELMYQPGSDPSIGTAGLIAPPPHQRQFPGAPRIGSAGGNQEWNNSVGNANEGDQQKHGFIYNLFHRNH